MNLDDKVKRKLFDDKKLSNKSQIKIINYVEECKGKGKDIPEGFKFLEIEEKYSYKFSLKNTIKSFMKNHTNIEIVKAIEEGLKHRELTLLNRLKYFLDENNCVDTIQLKKEFGYTNNEFSIICKSLKDKGLLRKINGFFYLNPVCGLKSQYINKNLIDLFGDTFERFKTKVITKRNYE